ncbi:MAG: hypothetical protein GKS05_09030 [Nitrospirales bacterium]|nr:hypothetical protein [Nitrospirales bacterium]
MITKAKLAHAEAVLKEYAHDLPEFILGTGWFLTQDEHDSDQIKPIPDQPNLRGYLTELQHERYVLTPKSRQMMVSWVTLAYLLAVVLIRKNQLVIVQTKREDDVKNLLDLGRFMYDHLPKFLQTIRPRVKGPRSSELELKIKATDSRMWGIPQGADVIRSNTVSVLYSDELDFQPEASASIRAAMPSLIGGGQFIATSSPSLEGIMKQLIHGVKK